MVEECVHILPSGRKCRRIPKRGQKFCSSHRPGRRRRPPLHEDHAFRQQMFAFVERLQTLSLPDLLYETTGLLTDIHLLIDRRCSRPHRLAFSRACAAAGLAADGLFALSRARSQAPPAQPPSHATSRPETSSPAPSRSKPPAPPPPPAAKPNIMARLHHAETLLNSGRTLTPQELTDLCSDLINTSELDG
jgi:hypothetical protein